MRKAFLIAALMITTSVGVAHAGDSFSFQINGQKVRIERPRNCTALSCLNIVAPGLMNSSSDDSSSSTASSNNDATNTNTTNTTAAPVAPQTNQVNAAPVAPVTTPAPVTTAAPVQQQAPVTASNTYAPLVATVPPLPGESNNNNNNTNITALPGQTSNVTTLPAPQPQPQVQQNVYAPAPQPNTYTPAPAPAQQTAAVQPQVQQVQQPAQQVVGGPLGMWMTEKNEGKVHIVDCGAKICGYAVNDRTGADGEQVLINMTPEGDSWHGKIHDTRSGGTYDSTIAMRGNDKMRVQGCAFGGMFCGGQTWSRVN
jgi:uncharacterized protein (DUF2147 family)